MQAGDLGEGNLNSKEMPKKTGYGSEGDIKVAGSSTKVLIDHGSTTLMGGGKAGKEGMLRGKKQPGAKGQTPGSIRRRALSYNDSGGGQEDRQSQITWQGKKGCLEGRLTRASWKKVGGLKRRSKA